MPILRGTVTWEGWSLTWVPFVPSGRSGWRRSADLLAGLQSEIRRVAKFLDIRADDGVVDAVAKATTFSSMKANAERLLDTYSFLVNKGTNGRWREVLADDDLVLYENAKTFAKESGISAECLAWLESGSRAGEP